MSIRLVSKFFPLSEEKRGGGGGGGGMDQLHPIHSRCLAVHVIFSFSRWRSRTSRVVSPGDATLEVF